MKAVEQAVAQSSSQNAFSIAKARAQETTAEKRSERFEAAFADRTRQEREAQAARDAVSTQERTQARLDAQREAFDARLAEGRQERGAIIDGYA